MTEQTGQQGPPQSEPPEWYKNPPPWWNSAPQQRAQPPPWQGQGQPQSPSNYDILTAIQGAPEKIVNAIREATKQVAPPPQQAAPPPPQQTNNNQQNNDTPPRPLTFAEKWYGLTP